MATKNTSPQREELKATNVSKTKIIEDYEAMLENVFRKHNLRKVDGTPMTVKDFYRSVYRYRHLLGILEYVESVLRAVPRIELDELYGHLAENGYFLGERTRRDVSVLWRYHLLRTGGTQRFPVTLAVMLDAN